jgi:WD40 repeat protein
VLSSGSTKAAQQRCTACAFAPDADALGLVTDSGAVYALHLNKQRYTLLDTLPSAGTAAAFMARLSRRLFVGCSSGDIHCFDISSSSARLAKLPGHRAAVASLSTKSDTEQLLSASADAVLLWDMQVRQCRCVVVGCCHLSNTAQTFMFQWQFQWQFQETVHARPCMSKGSPCC